MSRSAVVILFASCAFTFYAYGIFRPKVVLTVGIIILSILVWVPDAIYSRFQFTLDGKHSGTRVEGRSRIYSAVIKKFPEYYLTGVGIEQYYGQWGIQNGFYISRDIGVLGTHNTFSQVLVYWGLPGLFALLWLLWQAYRCLPPGRTTDPVYLCLIGISVSVLLESFVVHTFYGKEFTIALGLLAGSSQWTWIKQGIQSRFHFEARTIVNYPQCQKELTLKVAQHCDR